MLSYPNENYYYWRVIQNGFKPIEQTLSSSSVGQTNVTKNEDKNQQYLCSEQLQ